MSIFSRIFGDNLLDDISSKVDAISSHISNLVNSGTNVFDTEKIIEGYISQFKDEELKTIIGNVTVPFERINRYTVYDELYRIVHIIKRIVKIYKDNILQKDLVSGEVILYKPSNSYGYSQAKYQDALTYIKTIMDELRVRDLLFKRIVPHLLRYGDAFIEIVDLEKDRLRIPKPGDVITENVNYMFSVINRRIGNGISTSNIEDILFETLFDVSTIDDYIEEGSSGYDSDIDISRISKIALRYHSPHKIIILATDSGRVIGYLYVSDIENYKDIVLSPAYRFSSVISQISGVVKDSKTEIEKVTERLVKKLISKIIEKSGVNVKRDISDEEYDSILKKSIDISIYNTIKDLLSSISETNVINKRMKVRFIPPSRMVHFQKASSEYYPYGESIIDPLVFPGKLYLLHLISGVVMRLTRAVPIRKWILETGPRDIHSGLLNKLKRELRNKRITMEDLITFKNIPKLLSDFDDIVLFSKKGQRFLDFELVTAEDASTKVSDLEDARRELISVSGVPAAYLGFPDIVELRDQLVSINICFATEISAYQEIVCNSLSDMVRKICRVCEIEDLTKHVTIHITPPILLMLQMLEATVGSITNISTQLQSLRGVFIDPVEILKQYVPYIDWDSMAEKGRELLVKLQSEEV
ncbi:MAG: hypothetical protein QXD03_03650 [Candidatus Anstonellales archaeon]